MPDVKKLSCSSALFPLLLGACRFRQRQYSRMFRRYQTSLVSEDTAPARLFCSDAAADDTSSQFSQPSLNLPTPKLREHFRQRSTSDRSQYLHQIATPRRRAISSTPYEPWRPAVAAIPTMAPAPLKAFDLFRRQKCVSSDRTPSGIGTVQDQPPHYNSQKAVSRTEGASQCAASLFSCSRSAC